MAVGITAQPADGADVTTHRPIAASTGAANRQKAGRVVWLICPER